MNELVEDVDVEAIEEEILSVDGDETREEEQGAAGGDIETEPAVLLRFQGHGVNFQDIMRAMGRVGHVKVNNN
jgi:hypothetical protein